MKRVAVTVDLHNGDLPGDIETACVRLEARGIRATFFVPTAMLEMPLYREVCNAIVAAGHEAASHSHNHDFVEVQALMRGSGRELAFLARSKDIHEGYFQRPATAFRSPCWCHVGRPAAALLRQLGYRADSSATPQRLSVLSSTPFDNVWTFAPRGPFELVPGLLEIATSCFLVPAGAPSFLTLRRTGSRVLLRTLAAEAKLFARPFVVQLHVRFFNATSTARQNAPALTLTDFLPRRHGGFTFRHRLRSADAATTAAIANDLLDMIAPSECFAITELADEITASRCHAPSN